MLGRHYGSLSPSGPPPKPKWKAFPSNRKGRPMSAAAGQTLFLTTSAAASSMKHAKLHPQPKLCYRRKEKKNTTLETEQLKTALNCLAGGWGERKATWRGRDMKRNRYQGTFVLRLEAGKEEPCSRLMLYQLFLLLAPCSFPYGFEAVLGLSIKLHHSQASREAFISTK